MVDVNYIKRMEDELEELTYRAEKLEDELRDMELSKKDGLAKEYGLMYSQLIQMTAYMDILTARINLYNKGE